jgi:hypothetical protein
MRRLAGVLAGALLVVGPGGSSAGSHAVAPPKTTSVLALVTTYNGSRLAWLDPATLRALKRPSVSIAGGAWSPVFSPSGKQVALGGLGTIGVTIVDVRRMKVAGRVAATPYVNRRLEPILWSTPRRLLVLDSPRDSLGPRQRLLVVDPLSKKTVARYPTGEWLAWRAAGDRLVVLGRPDPGAQRLLLTTVAASGRLLGAIEIDVAPDQRMASSFSLPGFAADAQRQVAYLVGPETVTQVELESLHVSSIQLGRASSLAARLLGLLEDDAQAKIGHGPSYLRNATPLVDGRLAVSGSTIESMRQSPAGLELVDPRDGTRRTIEIRATAHELTQGLLLAFGTGWDGATQTASGMGISAFTEDGTHLWSSLGAEPVWIVETAGGYAYVPTPELAYPSGTRVIDLATGKVLRTVKRELPTFVTRG